jgi:hypothetical protein
MTHKTVFGIQMSMLTILFMFYECRPKYLRSESVLRLRGGGRFPLMRRVGHAFRTMPDEERLRLLDEVHKQAPIFDYGNDYYTRQLHKARLRWAKEEQVAKLRANSTVLRAADVKKSKAATSRAPAAPVPASLPDIARMARMSDRVSALRPYAEGQRGAVRPADAISAMAHLHSADGEDGMLLLRRHRVRYAPCAAPSSAAAAHFFSCIAAVLFAAAAVLPPSPPLPLPPPPPPPLPPPHCCVSAQTPPLPAQITRRS